jgi:hypothetical protein
MDGMIYTSLRELAEALDTLDMTDAAQVETYRRLIKVYMTASHNPPDGVVGVGIITYAEERLIAAQVTP